MGLAFKRLLGSLGGARDLTLIETILGTESANLIGYWPQDELSGTVAVNAEGTAARNGAYTGVTLGQSVSPFTAPLFDGVNDFTNIYSASLAGAFSGAVGTAMIFVKMSGSGVWTDGTQRAFITVRADNNNYFQIRKSSRNNQSSCVYVADGTVETVNKTSMSETGWMQWSITWDKTGSGNMIAYYNGQPEGSAQAIAGTWSGSGLDSTTTAIGAYSTGLSQTFDGYLAHCAIWTKALTAAQILAIYQASGLV